MSFHRVHEFNGCNENPTVPVRWARGTVTIKLFDLKDIKYSFIK